MTRRRTRPQYPDLAARGISAVRDFAGPFPPPRLAVDRSPRRRMKNPTTKRDRNSLRTTTEIPTRDSRSSPGIHAGSDGRDRGSRVDHESLDRKHVDGGQADASQADGKTNRKNDRSCSGGVSQRSRRRAPQKRVPKSHAP